MSRMFKSLRPICSECKQECVIIDVLIKSDSNVLRIDRMATTEVSECCGAEIVNEVITNE